MSIKIIPFDESLFTGFIYNGIERDITGEQVLPVIKFYQKFGKIYMGIYGDRVIGVGGMFKLWGDTGGCFLFLNKEIERHKKSVFKSILEYMRLLIKEYNIKTLSVECMDNSMEAQRLIVHLGFKKDKEIKMCRYIKGVS